ncbi:uridine kinase [Pseudactinotalea sp. HY160]|uniref:uridine kinase n=1 Tax=Pseudactinotalea sp. HY160 TaxID=2654490 RepID=UPI001D140687|nr:uridine kinase [Pseudactinotalea sp. HY160]
MGAALIDPAAAAVLRRAAAAGPRCGSTTVVAIDGAAGSGKTTLAGAVHRLAQGSRAGGEGAGAAHLLHMDDLYPGWSGLRAGGELLAARVLAPLSRDLPGSYERYDWLAGAYAETHEVPTGGLLVVEGVGSVRAEYAHLLSVVVEVNEPDAALRLRRWRDRDGADSAAHAADWTAQEAALHAEVGLSARATIRVDGHGRLIGGQ